MAFYNDKYTKAIDKMIVDTNTAMDKAVGWIKPRAPQIATVDALKNFAFMVNRWNPLFYDETYAAGTRWGGIIAYPMYQNSLQGNDIRTVDTPECGYDRLTWIGQNWEFYKPIRPGDTLKVWNRRPQIIEKTKPGEKGPRVFAVMEGYCDHINQNDELVSTRRQLCQRIFLDKGPEPYSMPHYQYTVEELEYLDRFLREEEVRGDNPRYWEDVNIGDETKPAVLPPSTFATNAIGGEHVLGFGMPIPPRELLHEGADRFADFVQDPETGLYEHGGGGPGAHWSHLKAQSRGAPSAYHYAVVSVYTMLRLITNWMGDDGFLRRYKWRHLFRTPVGDSNVTHGKVINKRVENGEYMVDILVRVETVRGVISECSLATVSLLSKEAGYKWK